MVEVQPPGAPAHQVNRVAEGWIRGAVGVVLLLMFNRPMVYLLFRSKFTWTFSDPAGNPLAYPQTVFFWSDLGVVAFALALIVEGIVLLRDGRRKAWWAAIPIMAAATVLNLVVTIWLYGTYGLQVMNALGMIFGVYLLVQQVARVRQQA